jgi:indolepyruvate ferredoxin oxidoreductase beta subunit
MTITKTVKAAESTINVVIAGVGGQGTVLASKLIAYAAMERGDFVRTAETIGMAQRGGSVLGHVRILSANAQAKGASLFSPLVPKSTATLLIGFEPSETVRALDFLRPGGVVVVNRQIVAPVTATLAKASYDGQAELDYLQALTQSQGIGTLIVVDGQRICETCGSPRVLNIALLGAAAASGALGFSAELIDKAIEAQVKQRFVDLNKQALRLGAAAFREEL